jgi:uncharacterized membrane protein
MKRISSFDKLLYVFITFIAALIIFRLEYFGNYYFIFLLWNLFLAWLPYMLGKYMQRVNIPWKQWLLALLWLLFLPNAFYIVTDLVHLRHTTSAPVWLDVAILFASAVVGLMMALVSLYRMEQFFLGRFGKRYVSAGVSVVLLLASFGVYLGRYLRWNSWDIITNPLALFASVANRVIFPFAHLRTWGMTFVLAVIFGLLYYMGKKIPALVADIKKDGL